MTDTTPTPTPDGAALLDEVERFHRRFNAFPTEAAYVAVTLWDAHAHLIECFETTPRIAFLSPEPGSGKSRALEIVELLTPRPVTTVSASANALYRLVDSAAAGAAFGVWASRRSVQPLEQVAAAATRIAGGELTTRLPATDDPDLLAIVASFNSMVDALAVRIERDARFVGDVSHELRSPLTGVVTSVEVLAARRAELSPRADQALTLVQGELRRFRQMLDDLLELARIDGAPQGEAVPVPVSALVREVIAATGRDPGLLVADPDEETTVLGDKRSLERAVRNLLDNADRHAGGASAVHVQRREGTVVVSVDDDGPGVAAEDRERVFERFARGPNAARRSLPGAGLGLAIVAETAGQHGGAAWVSEAPGGGARFSLSLPVGDR